MITSWHSYGKIYAVGHSAVANLFEDEVVVEEKIDGSQFSFGIFDGEIKVRSKGKEILLDAPEKMFQPAIDTVLMLKDKLHNGWTYRAEFLGKNKHNVLAYDRVPKHNLIIFDINTGQETYLSPEDKKLETERLDLECVPVFFKGKIDSFQQFYGLLDNISVLGGQKVEGFVVKNYFKFGKDGKVQMGKYVSEHFKEVHNGEWKEANPGPTDIVALLVAQLKNPARWDKAIQHLKEQGLLTNTPADIGKLVKEIQKDTEGECKELVMNALYDWAWPKISRQLPHGFPEYYKTRVAASAFGEGQ